MGDSDDEVELIRRVPDEPEYDTPKQRWLHLYVSKNIETLRQGALFHLEEFINCQQIGTAPPEPDDPEGARAGHAIGSARLRRDFANLLEWLNNDYGASKRRPYSIAIAIGLCLWEKSKFRDALAVSNQNIMIIGFVRRATIAFTICRVVFGPLIRKKLIKDVSHVKSLLDDKLLVEKKHEPVLVGALWRFLRWL